FDITHEIKNTLEHVEFLESILVMGITLGGTSLPIPIPDRPTVFIAVTQSEILFIAYAVIYFPAELLRCPQSDIPRIQIIRQCLVVPQKFHLYDFNTSVIFLLVFFQRNWLLLKRKRLPAYRGDFLKCL